MMVKGPFLFREEFYLINILWVIKEKQLFNNHGKKFMKTKKIFLPHKFTVLFLIFYLVTLAGCDSNPTFQPPSKKSNHPEILSKTKNNYDYDTQRTIENDELLQRSDIQNITSLSLLHENYRALDQQANEYRTKKSRTPSGLWKLTLFYYAINDFAAINRKDEKYWSSLKSKTEQWIKEYPESPTSYIAHGIVLMRYAWKFRGGGFADTVPDDACEPFHENLIKAKEFLEKNKKIASKDPHWYEVMAAIAIPLNTERSEFQKIIDEGLKKEPLYYQLYFAAVDYYAPKWHGNEEEIEALANWAVELTKKQEGLGMYARIYWCASQTQYGKHLFMDSNVVWKKMKQGIDDVLKRYPDQWNINNFALFACLANDKAKARELFTRITNPMYRVVWDSESDYQQHKAWAFEQ